MTKSALDAERWTLWASEEKEGEEVRVMDSEPAKKCQYHPTANAKKNFK